MIIHHRMIIPIIPQKLSTLFLKISLIGMTLNGARIYKIQCFFIVSYVNGSDNGSKNFLS